ncbi:MAG: peptidylprolyl isomerase [Geobacteraceae bacterium]|nr:peptidylprolyl isomerase [Geobacteraceae bacterium]
MQIMKKTALRPIVATLAVAIALSGTAFAAQKKKPTLKKPTVSAATTSAIVAKVNGTSITREELDRAMKFMLAQSQTKQELTAEQKKNAESAVLDQLISAELLYQAGKKLTISDIEKQVDSQVSEGRSKFPTQEAYDTALKKSGLTEKNIKEFARKEIYINNLIETQIASKVTITDADAKKFYDENVDKFKQPETVQASHILIGVDATASTEDKVKAKEKAAALLKRAKAGEDFATLAKENSTCPSAQQGGNLGYFSKGQMVPEFDTVAFSLKPGEISEVVETKFGYHIIKVVDKKPAGTIAFSEAKADIIKYLKIQKIQQGINELVEKLRKDAKVEIVTP